MSNSVVKVTDSTLSDSLFLLVGEDGTVTPSKDVVESYLSSKTGSTNLQVMQINKSDDQSIEVAINDMLYVPQEEGVEEEIPYDEVAYNLYNIRLDHDYTRHFKPPDEIDELAKTLSILDGDGDNTSHTVTTKSSRSKSNDSSTLHNNYVTKVKTVHSSQVKSISKSQKKVKLKEIKDESKDNDEESLNNSTSSIEEDKPKTPKSKDSLTKISKASKLESPQQPTDVKQEKKQQKKDKKAKPVLDDFALFSTPDIIRRVGGKDGQNVFPSTPPASELIDDKPAKIEGRSKSMSESSSASKKQNRLSLDGKVLDKSPSKFENKVKEKKSESYLNVKQTRTESPKKVHESKKQNIEETNRVPDENYLTENPTNKSFVPNLSMETNDLPDNEQNMTLDGNSLDLDPTLLDTINNDLISEDILYQVAQSLVSNAELQNAIDRSLNEENLVLNSTIPEVSVSKEEITNSNVPTEQATSTETQKGKQIVRPDGRIVIIPPIERPTTRSRNKRREDGNISTKTIRKPLDEEHVSGNELDSSGQEEEEEEEDEEEESEDDPNKLWCICNQPHNNRFMICCDTCEEWYHGKCVNITKAMGQQMELEGKEWICLFCKDPHLKRPQAAARRIRKASRNSRHSSESNNSAKLKETKLGSVPCVVCQKPSRVNSIFCSESCILAHAQGVERVVVFERATGNMLTGNKAPSAVNLEQWLKEHPGYEVVRSAGKIVTTKTQNTSPSKLKLVKNLNSDLDSPQKKYLGFKKRIKTLPPVEKSSNRESSPKVINKQILSQQKDKSNNQTNRASAITTPSKPKVTQVQVKSTNLQSKEKSTPPKVAKIRTEHVSPNTSHNKQENIRENVQKTLFEQLTNRLKVANDIKLSEEELKEISTEIESQLYKCFGDTGQKYRNKYRSLIFNIKDIKNQTLWRRICEKSINPYQLVRLSPDDLASQELALWREREAKHQLDMIKKSELELLKCNRQYVLKTHKGEQILEDDRPTDNIDNTEVITSLTDGTNGEKSDRKKEASRDDKKSSKNNHKDKERKSSKEKSDRSRSHHRHESSSKDRDRSRKRSRSRDKSKHSEKRRSRSREKDRHRKSSHKSSRHKKETHSGSSTEKLDKKSKEILEQLVDNKIVPPLEDRLWKNVPQEETQAPAAESDSDHEPSSTVTIPTPPRNNESDEVFLNQGTNNKNAEKEETVAEAPVTSKKSEEIWRGVINMIDVAQISITAHEVSGDCTGLAMELPKNLDIVGRISPDTVWDYIGKMKCSNSKIISVVRLNAINVEEKMPYLALYSYLSSRNRLGVVKSTNKAVKDFYILPLASQKPIPQVLLPLNGPGFEEARPALLLGIIVRDKRKRPYVDTLSPVSVNPKKSRTELPLMQSSPSTRSYTPPPVKDSKLKLPLPLPAMEDGDEPYSPEDSDPDCMPPTAETFTNRPSNFLETDVGSAQPFQPFVNKFEDIPGLDNASLPSNTQEIQREMEKLNKEIEMQKSEIHSISQNIATASNEIGTSALANISLPSNLQQILDSIKTIGSSSAADAFNVKAQDGGVLQENADFTIPLMLPTTFSRHSGNSSSENTSENTIPLNLPKKKTSSDTDKAGSVLSSLSEEDLIRKAEEMLGGSQKSSNNVAAASAKNANTSYQQLEQNQPPIPGLEDTNI